MGLPLILILHVVTPSYLGSLSVGLNAALIYLRRLSEEFWALKDGESCAAIKRSPCYPGNGNNTVIMTETFLNRGQICPIVASVASALPPGSLVEGCIPQPRD
jgi:hypothetical protein